MLYIPKNTKFEKVRKKIKIKQNKTKQKNKQKNRFTIKTKKFNIITLPMLENIRRIIIKKIKNHSKIWFYINFNYPQYKNSEGTRMGKGKGSFSHYVAPIPAYTVIVEFQNCDNLTAKRILKQCQEKTNLNLFLTKTFNF